MARTAWGLATVLATLLTIESMPRPLRAQVPFTSTISGTVTDPTGAVVRGALVELLNIATRQAKSQTTNDAGVYVFPTVSPAVYEIGVTMQGFRRAVVPSFKVDMGHSYQVDFTLQLGPVTETLTVKAINLGEPVILEQAERTDTVTLLNSAELQQRHASTVVDALNIVPGIETPRTELLGLGAHGGDILIRGLGRSGSFNVNQDIAVFIDGRPDFSGTTGRHYQDFFSLDNVESVEVIRGPSPILYGSGALAGVIDITTREPRSRLGLDAESSGGSFGTTENFGRLSYGGERLFAVLGIDGRRTDGHRLHSAYEGGDVHFKGGAKLSKRFTLSADWGYDRFELQDPGQLGGRPGLLDEASWHMGGGLRLVGRFERSETSVLAWGSGGNLNLTTFRSSQIDRNVGARFKESLFLFRGNRLVLGADVTRYGGTRSGAPPSTQYVTSTEPYLFVEQSLTSHLTLAGGVRGIFHSEFGSQPSGDAGIILRPGGGRPGSLLSGTALRFHYTRGFRAPNVTELFFSPQANPSLQPENLTQYEVGWNQKMGARLTFDLAGFLQSGDNFIQLVPSPLLGGQLRFQNTGRFAHRGIESSVSVRPLDGVTVSFASANLRLGRETAVVPLDSYALGISYMRGNLFIALNGYLAHDLFGLNNRQQRLPDYFLANAKLSYRLKKHYRVFVEVDNITDKSYQTVPGFPMPGLSAFSGLHLSL